MTGDHAQVGAVDGSGAAIHVELPGAFGNVIASQKFGRTLGDELVAGAVETPPPDAELMPLVGTRVADRSFWYPLVKRGFEQPNQRHRGNSLREEPDAADVGRIVGRGNAAERLHGL